MYTFLFPLSKLGIPFLVSQKVTNELLALEFALLFLVLNFSYLVLLFFFLTKKKKKKLKNLSLPYKHPIIFENPLGHLEGKW